MKLIVQVNAEVENFAKDVQYGAWTIQSDDDSIIAVYRTKPVTVFYFFFL